MHRRRDDQADGRGYEDLCAGWSASAIVIIWREKHVDERCKKTVVIKNLYYGERERERGFTFLHVLVLSRMGRQNSFP